MSGEWYFYLDQGKTVGPVGPEDVAIAIRSGVIGPFDLLYRDGHEKWLPCYEFKVFSPLFERVIQVRPEDSWVVLQKKTVGATTNYLQKGPFPTEKIKDLLKAGDVRYGDFIWREGQKKWQRISTLEIFNPPPVQWQPTVKLPQDVQLPEAVTTHELLSEVVTQVHFRPQQPEAPPPEASSEDMVSAATLATGAPVGTTSSEVIRKVPRSPSPRPVIKQVTVVEPLPSWPLVIKKKRSWLHVVMMLMFVLLPLNGIYFIYKQNISTFIKDHSLSQLFQVDKIKKTLGVREVKKNQQNQPAQELSPSSAERSGFLSSSTQEVAPAPAVQTQPQAPAVVPPPLPEEAPRESRKEPHYLKMWLGKWTSTRRPVEFSTDASSHFPIRVLITGDSGEVLDQVSVYRELTVKWKVGEKPSLDLSTLGLTEGAYRLQATLQDFVQTLPFRIGQDNENFRARLQRHRKFISLPFQRERRRLIMVSHELFELGQKLEGQIPRGEWRQQLANFNKQNLSTLNLNNPKALVFPEFWFQVRDQRKALGELATNLDRAQQQPGGEVDSSALQTWLTELKQLEGKIQRLSLYR